MCNCLTEFDASLPHYVHCATANGHGVSNAARTLAEIASYRDIDTALTCLRELTK